MYAHSQAPCKLRYARSTAGSCFGMGAPSRLASDMIEEDIRRARTLPASFYRDPAIFERLREKVVARSWQLVNGAEQVSNAGSILPFTFLEGCVDEPLLLARDAGGTLHGLSNVCTHRGNLLCTRPEVAQSLRCRYHVPFVHPDLAKTIDYGSYRTELSGWSSLQVAESAAADDAFDGSTVAAYYFFLFPNTMLNFYPWGLSINVVVPLAVDRTRIVYRSWVLDPSRRGRGAGGALDRVELEDEAVVEQVQRGVRSRLYDRGRYSPSREAGVHHFHRLLASLSG